MELGPQPESVVEPPEPPASRFAAMFKLSAVALPRLPLPPPSPSTSSSSGSDSSSSSGQDIASPPVAPAAASDDFYTHCQWTFDGSTVIATSAERGVDFFVISNDRPETPDGARELIPDASLHLSEPTREVAPAPNFSIAYPETNCLLVGCKDLPIQLYHTPWHNAPPRVVCSYKLIKKETEAYITPASMLWLASGTHFVVGSTRRLDYFDVQQSMHKGPVLTCPTVASGRRAAGPMSMKGIIASLSAPPPWSPGARWIAAGTWTRWVGLYDMERERQAVATWSVADAAATEWGVDVGGRGVSQTIWSPCGRYLVINERASTGLLVYDVRVTKRPVAVLLGRASSTPQRLSCDVVSMNQDGSVFEIWAGTQNGEVLRWDDVGRKGTTQEPSGRLAVGGSAPVGAVAVNQAGWRTATCSGGWAQSSDAQLDAAQHFDLSRERIPGRPRSAAERSLRIWDLHPETGSTNDAMESD